MSEIVNTTNTTDTTNTDIAWYKRRELLGLLSIFAAVGLMQFEPYTVAYIAGQSIAYLTGGATVYQGLVKGYKSDNLPGWLTAILDVLPNVITGIKGESK